MNLLEALQSGKPFKRPNWDDYYKIHQNGLVGVSNNCSLAIYYLADLISDDYEIKENKIELTKSQFIKVFKEYYPNYDAVANAMATELGFK